MCHCEDITNCKNSALHRVDYLYDNEWDSDVVFLVGSEPDVWRIPGHKKILTKANVVFRALMNGPLSTGDKTIVVEDVEGRSFDYLLRYLYGNKVSFQSSTTALSTLYAAHKYLCPGLIELCVKYLDENLNEKNVIEIFCHARLYAIETDRKRFEPSAPVESTENCDYYSPVLNYSPNINNNTIEDSVTNNNNNNDCRGENNNSSVESVSISFWSEALVRNCLQYIDENADLVLNQEAVEDMSSENLREIIKRDTLKIQSENVVFSALDRWANRECKRRKLNLNSKNRRLVLGNLIYEIRFPFLTADEFLFGPTYGGWLDQDELTFFSGLISKSKIVGQIPSGWRPYMDKICRRRLYFETESFIPSQRTNDDLKNLKTEEEEEESNKKSNFGFGKIVKSKRSGIKDKGQRKTNTSDENEKSCTKCFSEFVVDVLVCLFD